MEVGERVGFDGAELARTSRLVAKVDSAAVQDGFHLYLHGFIVADDGRWVVVQQGMNTRRKQARRYHWLSEKLTSFVDAPHAAIGGAGQGVIINLADRRAAASRARQLDLLQDIGPDGIARELVQIERAPARHAEPEPEMLLPHLALPEHHDVRPEDVIERRLHGALAAAARSWPEGLFGAVARAGGRRTHRPGARDGRGGRSRSTLPLQRSGSVLASARRKGSPPLPGTDPGL